MLNHGCEDVEEVCFKKLKFGVGNGQFVRPINERDFWRGII